MRNYLAVLETMWDWESQTTGAGYTKTAPDFFSISPNNFSGKRLYYLTGLDSSERLWCTNVCPELVSHPSQHGTPNVEWLTRNLERWLASKIYTKEGTDKVVLVCGEVAQTTMNHYRYSGGGIKDIPAQVLYLPHPANRTWSRATLDAVRDAIDTPQGNWRFSLRKGELDVQKLWGHPLVVREETSLIA